MSISIVVSMYNVKQPAIDVIDNLLLPSLLKNASSDKEIIFVEDGSPLKKETYGIIRKYKEGLAEFGNVDFVDNEENLGWAKSYNKGIRAAGGDIILQVDQDVYFPKSSIDRLVTILIENPQLGMLTPITNRIDSGSYEHWYQAPQIQSYHPKELAKIELAAKKMWELNGKQVLEVNRDGVMGFCYAIPRELVKELQEKGQVKKGQGPYDEIFKYAFWGDTDLIRRIEKDYKLGIAAGVHVHHGLPKHKPAPSVWQHPVKATWALWFFNPFRYGIKWHDYREALKHIKLGIKRNITNRDNIGEYFDKVLEEKGIDFKTFFSWNNKKYA